VLLALAFCVVWSLRSGVSAGFVWRLTAAALVLALVTHGLPDRYGVLAQTLMFVALARHWWRMDRSPERALIGLTILLLLAASLGMPSLTANRVATVVWVVLSCLLLTKSRKESAKISALLEDASADPDAPPPSDLSSWPKNPARLSIA
jgi:hypothetical protein